LELAEVVSKRCTTSQGNTQPTNLDTFKVELSEKEKDMLTSTFSLVGNQRKKEVKEGKRVNEGTTTTLFYSIRKRRGNEMVQIS